jgi:hypothetical protein
MARRVPVRPPWWAGVRLLAVAAALAGLFLMHGTRIGAGDCHGTDGMGAMGGMGAMTGGTAAMAAPATGHVSHFTAPAPGADGASHASCVSLSPRPADAALAGGLVLVGFVAVPPARRAGWRTPFGRGRRRRAPPSSGALPLSLGVSRT